MIISKKTSFIKSELKIQSSLSNSIISKEIFVDDLIFHVDKITKNQRLYISSNFIKKIFIITHEINNHFDFQKCYEIIITF